MSNSLSTYQIGDMVSLGMHSWSLTSTNDASDVRYCTGDNELLIVRDVGNHIVRCETLDGKYYRWFAKYSLRRLSALEVLCKAV